MQEVTLRSLFVEVLKRISHPTQVNMVPAKYHDLFSQLGLLPVYTKADIDPYILKERPLVLDLVNKANNVVDVDLRLLAVYVNFTLAFMGEVSVIK